ncbi:MAG TPA: class I SAM-dependent methyltransferase [Stellaceae bacterium]|nr:class I SAM-dependent methyltransferase [Stellaceae bacterium]
MQAETELERWNSRFSGEDYVFGTEPNFFLEAQAHRLKPGQTALALADGEGRNGVWLAERGLDVLSVDFSPAAQEKARRLAARRGVAIRTELADLATWRWEPERFDLVAAIFFQFADPPLRSKIFAGIKTALKPGGLLMLQGYRPEQLQYQTGGPSQVENLYTAAMLRAAFADMEILHLAEHDSVIEEGSRHSGMSALVDLVARKPRHPPK